MYITDCASLISRSIDLHLFAATSTSTATAATATAATATAATATAAAATAATTPIPSATAAIPSSLTTSRTTASVHGPDRQSTYCNMNIQSHDLPSPSTRGTTSPAGRATTTALMLVFDRVIDRQPDNKGEKAQNADQAQNADADAVARAASGPSLSLPLARDGRNHCAIARGREAGLDVAEAGIGRPARLGREESFCRAFL